MCMSLRAAAYKEAVVFNFCVCLSVHLACVVVDALLCDLLGTILSICAALIIHVRSD
jgi:hypothetical protein